MTSATAPHGRVVRVGQIWRSNDPRGFRGVRVVDLTTRNIGTADEEAVAIVENIVTKKTSAIAVHNFTVGARGWSLEKEAA